MLECPETGLLLPKDFVDQKMALKKFIDDWVDQAVNMNPHFDKPYFIVFHAKFNPQNPGEFHVDPPKLTEKLPPFMSNQMVFWVCQKRGIKEMLWMVPPKLPGEKLKVEFNKKGVAYLQAKSAMPS
jgi:hypothetical protein